MRILHLINTLNPAYGGPVESVKQLGLAVQRMGATLEIAVCGDVPDDPWIEAFPLRVYALGPGWGKYAYTPRLRPWLERHGADYDAWVVNGIWQYQSFCARRAAAKLGMPYFVYVHGMLDPWSRRAHPVKYLKKLVYWTLFERWALRSAKAVFFTADEEAALAAAYFPFGAWKSFVIGAGVSSPPPVSDAEKEAFLERFPQLRDTRCWIFLGRLHPKKGIDLVLKSVARIKAESRDVKVLIAGPGDASYVDYLRRLTKELRLADVVVFSGPLYGNDKWIALGLSEVFLLPSHQENFGIAVAEALAAGVPVCISDKVNIWREIEAAQAGMVSADNVEGTTEALLRWSGLSGAERLGYSARAQECFLANFEIGHAARRLVEIVGREQHRTGVEK
jgi:glycosyltransferase involved in cell wall biosynthesis